MRYLHFHELPAGINAIVGIMCYTGYNQEDSVIMNRSAVERGFFKCVACWRPLLRLPTDRAALFTHTAAFLSRRSVSYHTYKTAEETGRSDQGDIRFEKPDRESCAKMRNANYDKVMTREWRPLCWTACFSADLVSAPSLWTRRGCLFVRSPARCCSPWLTPPSPLTAGRRRPHLAGRACERRRRHCGPDN